MTWICFFILFEIILFSTYIIYVLHCYGIPQNISATYYYFERKHKHYGLLFPLCLFIACLIIIPIWIYTCQFLSSWASHFTWCAYLTCLCMFVVGITSRYKRSRALTYCHYTAAIVGSVFTVVWLLFACYRIAFVSISILLIALLAGYITHTLRECYLFWLELTAFYALFIVIFIINLFNLCV